MTTVRIAGWGAALPDKTITNDDLATWLDTSDEWIRERTGIAERRVGSSTTELAVAAGRQALVRSPGAVDAVIVATLTPDQETPATASVVQAALGLDRCAAFDLNAACSGFVYGLVVARGLMAAGLRRILLIGAETMSRIVDWDDRETAVLFGDGAGAVVLEATDGPDTLLGHDLGGDGAAAPLLWADRGDVLHMDGREVYRRAVRALVESSTAALDRAGLTVADVGLFVPHQANRRIIEASAERLGIPPERVALMVERTGNTSAASIPLALCAVLDEGRVHPGEILLLSGVGAGMAWGSAVLRWQP
ncbi:MAG: ketoacyl-ACP synthase III [Acidimicrobiales bacterium]|nr:ketoacyl-ACP synthase III [Acidimicrobiales bacterium]